MNSTQYALVSGWSGVVSTPPPPCGGTVTWRPSPPGVGGKCRPWGGADMGGGGTNAIMAKSASLRQSMDILHFDAKESHSTHSTHLDQLKNAPPNPWCKN